MAADGVEDRYDLVGFVLQDLEIRPVDLDDDLAARARNYRKLVDSGACCAIWFAMFW